MWAALPADSLTDIRETALRYSVIGIDEGQFVRRVRSFVRSHDLQFSDIATFSDEMASLGKTVIIAALDGTFERKAFGNVLDLVPIAESITKLTAVCMACYRPASFSKRLGNEKEVKVIGGADKYAAVCRECHRNTPGNVSPKKPNAAAILNSTAGEFVDNVFVDMQ
jgi:thymidine kinase